MDKTGTDIKKIGERVAQKTQESSSRDGSIKFFGKITKISKDLLTVADAKGKSVTFKTGGYAKFHYYTPAPGLLPEPEINIKEIKHGQAAVVCYRVIGKEEFVARSIRIFK